MKTFENRGTTAHEFNKSRASPEVGDLEVGVGITHGETRGEYSAIILRLVRTMMVRRIFNVCMLL